MFVYENVPIKLKRGIKVLAVKQKALILNLLGCTC